MATTLTAILEKIEAERQIYEDKVNSYLNQPSIITLTSGQTNILSFNYNLDETHYNGFTVNLNKPAIGIKSAQLLSANIPQSHAEAFDDSELVFCYYKIKSQTNNLTDIEASTIFREQISYDNLYYIRLLPSYYKKEYIPDYENYGFNKQFNNYEELSAELAKSCTNDLLSNKDGDPERVGEKFLSDDCLIYYDAQLKKFRFQGNNVFEPWSDMPVWNFGDTFNLNDLVLYDEVVYISKINNNMSEPVDGDFWGEYEGSYYTYLVAGFKDPNVATLQNAIKNASVFDFFYDEYNNLPLISIPEQPYIENKTLSLRLGFTWNGVMPLLPVGVTTRFSPEEYSRLSIFYNRLRPIPYYNITFNGRPPTLQINDENDILPYRSDVYTADAFCNMVYSSLVKIYSNLSINGSLDTADNQNQNILALMPINCGQFGVSFTNNFIDNSIVKVNKDINFINITMYNELDKPYYISNNGICSFVLKLTY